MVLDLKEVSVALLANCLPFPNFAFVFYTRERETGKRKVIKSVRRQREPSCCGWIEYS